MSPSSDSASHSPLEKLFSAADQVGEPLRATADDRIVETLYERAADIAGQVVTSDGQTRPRWDQRLDAVLTSRVFGLPIMLLGLVVIFWMTIAGANVPSAMLAKALFAIGDWLEAGFTAVGAPWWLTGFLITGVYRALAWVIAVMLPPMAIFFPLFTLLEDFGYLPRVAFNLDRLFRWAGGHGKQSLTMAMGFGCNAAGVTACRIIDSPRERLIAIVTNNFILCNGRWPTVILLATIFIAAAVPAGLASLAATGAVVAVTLLGMIVALLVSAALSRTALRGEPSAFLLELPPYRRPQILKVLYRSLLDRTLFVLGRACATAVPAGAVIWILGNVYVGEQSLMTHASGALNPVGWALGLDGVILLAYIVAIPANEIIVPTIIMGYLASGQMTELDSTAELAALFTANGFTLLTAVCLMLFCLLHHPCATTTWTIWRETRSVKWTIIANVLPLGIGVVTCLVVAQVSRYLF